MGTQQHAESRGVMELLTEKIIGVPKVWSDNSSWSTSVPLLAYITPLVAHTCLARGLHLCCLCQTDVPLSC
eukprot:6394946-Amphidinium_carterae.2